jgi:hypothetical protein
MVTVSSATRKGDAYNLEQLVPDAAERDRVMSVARGLMEHPEYIKVRNALWRRLQHRHHLSCDEVQRVAETAANLPDAASREGAPRSEAAASTGVSGLSIGEAADAASGVPRPSLPPAGFPIPRR